MPEQVGEQGTAAQEGQSIFLNGVKRPLMPVVLALTIGLGAASWGLTVPGIWLLAALAGLWAAMFFLYGARLPARLMPLLFFTVLGVGLYHQALAPDFPPHHLTRLPRAEEVVLSGRLTRPSRVGPEQVQLYVALEAWKSPQGWRPAAGQLLVTSPPRTPPPVGTRLVVRGKLREPRALLNPGAVDRPRQLAADGIFRQMQVQDPGHLVFLASPEDVSLAERLRGGIRRILGGMAPNTAAIFLSMLLGDQGEVTPEMRENLARTGTSHLLVINGMHLGAVAAVTYFLVFWLLRRFPCLLLRVNAMKLATLAAVFPVLAYAHLAGGSPSTQRAEIMVLAYLLLVFLGRPREIWSALALAALAILTLSPLRLFSVSFQLSFAAVGGILYLLPRWLPARWASSAGEDSRPLWRRRLGRWTGEALAVSAAASLATMPLVAHHFQVVSLFGFLVNLAAIPLFLMLALPLGELAVLAEAFSLTPVAQALLQWGEIPLKLGYGIIVWVARLPGSGLTVPTPTWVQVALWYAVIFLLFPRRRSVWTWAGAGLGTAALAVTLILPLMRSPQACEVTILDSNAGLEGVVVAPGGQRLVVSAAWPTWPGQEAGGRGPLPGYLHWRQYRRLDAVLALQLNARNAQELLTLVQQFQVGGFWWKGARPAGKVVALLNLLGDAGRPALSLDQGNPPGVLGGVALAFPTWGKDQGVGLKVTCQGKQVLILPPLPRLQAADPTRLPVDLLEALVAPSDAPSELVARFKTRHLVFYGSRGRPSQPTLARIPTYRTEEGAVSLYLSREDVTVTQWRP